MPPPHLPVQCLQCLSATQKTEHAKPVSCLFPRLLHLRFFCRSGVFFLILLLTLWGMSAPSLKNTLISLLYFIDKSKRDGTSYTAIPTQVSNCIYKFNKYCIEILVFISHVSNLFLIIVLYLLSVWLLWIILIINCITET